MYRHRRPWPAALVALIAAVVAVPLVVTATPVQAVTCTSDTSSSFAFTAPIKIGNWERGCSGALVNAEWLLTAASCFATDPAISLSVPSGPPALRTVATIGRTDLLTQTGQVRTVFELVRAPTGMWCWPGWIGW
jgi:Trypsin